MPLPVVEFITRNGCCLCDEALAVVRRARDAEPFELVLVDVDADADLAEEHGAFVPVVLVEGRRFAAYHVDEEPFVARVRQAARSAA